MIADLFRCTSVQPEIDHLAVSQTIKLDYESDCRNLQQFQDKIKRHYLLSTTDIGPKTRPPTGWAKLACPSD